MAAINRQGFGVHRYILVIVLIVLTVLIVTDRCVTDVVLLELVIQPTTHWPDNTVQ